jgi:hypothetical protein
MPVSHGANSNSFKRTMPSDREITITRLFDAPRRLVFDAMTIPEHVRRWWGSEPFPDAESIVTQVLTEEGSKTRLTITSLYPSLDVRDMVLKTGMEKGAASSTTVWMTARELHRS